MSFQKERLLPLYTLRSPDQYEIYVFLRGDIIDYFCGNIRKHLVRGDALIVSPNELHRPYLIKETAYERVIIHVNQDVIKKLSTPVSTIYRFLEQYNCCFFPSAR